MITPPRITSIGKVSAMALAGLAAAGLMTAAELGSPANSGETRAAIVEIERVSDGTRLCLGTSLKPLGVIATKASELESEADNAIAIRLGDGRTVPITRRHIDAENDLAILTPAKPMEFGITLEPVGDIPPGRILTSLMPDRLSEAEPLVGVAGAPTRTIERRNGVMGVELDSSPSGAKKHRGVRIDRIFPNSAAGRAGVKVGDRILSANGTDVANFMQVRKIIFAHDPGDKVELRLSRGGEPISKTIILGYWSDDFDLRERNQRMSGATSRRKSGFTRAMQHDIALPPDLMGGPVFNLDGRAVGINIARQDRVTTYALPGAVVLSAVKSAAAETRAEDDAPPTD